MTTLFISDLHLSTERPQISALFLDFLRQQALNAEALYILGDLFEYWIGDDVIAQPEYAPIVSALRTFTQAGVPLYLMHGNRDFLLGEEFCRATGATLLPDPTLIDLYGQETLLMHGDLLCTDDVEYQAVRTRIRDPRFIQGFLSKPAAERDAVVRDYRAQSKAVTEQKSPQIMDVNTHTVVETMQRHRVQRLIHGHTHRPATHRHVCGTRIVLGDWYEQGSVLRCDRDGCTLTALAQ